MECLICEEQMTRSEAGCKMCGMGIGDKKYRYGEYLFCSEKCLRVLRNILNAQGEGSEIVGRKIVI